VPNEIDNQAFEYMTAATDKTNVDLSDIKKNTGWSSLAPSKYQTNEFSYFSTLLKETNPELTDDQIGLLKEWWKKGGKPQFNIRGGKPGRASYQTGKDFYNTKYDISNSSLTLYKEDLLDDFVAEISHALDYSQKEGESLEEWKVRRIEKDKKNKREKELDKQTNLKRIEGARNEDRYGTTKSYLRKENNPRYKDYTKRFPYSDTTRVSYDEKSGQYKDEEGVIQVNPDGTPLRQTNMRQGGTIPLGWETVQQSWTEFDPITRLGLEGQALPFEFNVHGVIQDSLYNLLGHDVYQKDSK
jgi:hypothetical protein